MVIEDLICFNSEVYCLGYHCGYCNNFLFNSADIIFKTSMHHRIFIFTRNLIYTNRIRIFGTNGVYCNPCHNGIGGMVYRDWNLNNHLVRFPNNVLQQYSILLWKNS